MDTAMKKIVGGVIVPRDTIEQDITLMYRMRWIDGDKRALHNRFSGKNIRQNAPKLANIKARERRLRQYGWPLTAFPS